MNILGISAFYHDAAAAVLVNGEIVAAAQEERFTRKKNDPSFPVNAIRYCLTQASLGMDDIDAVVFYDKPFLKFERLLETYIAFAPRGLFSFVRSMPAWLNEKLFIKQTLRRELRKIGRHRDGQLKILFPEHHLSHAASAYFPSGFDDAAILTIDGVGEWATATICSGSKDGIEMLRQLEFPHSVGLLYSSVTYYCGFKVNSGEYKLMGLAPYGNNAAAGRLATLIRENLIRIADDGSIALHQEYFRYTTALRMLDDSRWADLFGFERRAFDTPILQCYCDLALAIQKVIEEIVLKMAIEAKRLTGYSRICLAGGVALNCVANGMLSRSEEFDDIFIQPAAGDAGGAIGAALAGYHIYFGKPRSPHPTNYFLGPQGDEADLQHLIDDVGAVPHQLEEQDIYRMVARALAAGQVVGWFHGRMEFGPRALGNRSILADPRDPGMKNKINSSIKFREDFRPFAPAITAEEAHQYFEGIGRSPYMLFTYGVKEQYRAKLPAITHVDGSARVQTVDKADNPAFYNLLAAFKDVTGLPILINTSFNVRGEPIVNTYEQAYSCFMETAMDMLVLDQYLFVKKEQPAWQMRHRNFEID